MEQHDPQPPMRADTSHGRLSPSLPPTSRRSAIVGALAALLVIALSITLFASLSNQRGALGAAAECTPTATADTPTAALASMATPTATTESTPTAGSTPTTADTPTVAPSPTAVPSPTATSTQAAEVTPTAEGTPTVEGTPTTEGTPAVACTPEASTPTATPSPTLGTSKLQAPKRGKGLPAGVEVTSFALTGPDEGWGTGSVITNPMTGFPDRSMVLHYTGGSWQQVGPTLPGLTLGGIDMLSSSEGWAMGVNDSSKSFLLHIHNGAWQQESLPPDPGAVAAVMAMRTPVEGWLAMANLKTAYSGANTSLFHYSGGTWSLVRDAPYYITDIAPVADGEAWVIGWNTDGSSSLVHVRGGMGTVEQTGPANSSFSRLRMFAPNDIWIEGAIHAATHVGLEDVQLNYHFDGKAWSKVSLPVPSGVQHASTVSSDTAWSFVSVRQASPDPTYSTEGHIASIYSNAGGHWQALSVPYNDLQSLTVVSNSSTDVWAVGVYTVTTQVTSNSYSGVSHGVLLHYSDGTWTEYGR